MTVMGPMHKEDAKLYTATSVCECTAGGWLASKDSKQEGTYKIEAEFKGIVA